MNAYKKIIDIMLIYCSAWHFYMMIAFKLQGRPVEDVTVEDVAIVAYGRYPPTLAEKKKATIDARLVCFSFK